LNLGIALADQANLHEALVEFSEATRLAPDSALAHYNKGRVLFDMGDKEEAQAEVTTAYRLNPNYAGALYLLALLERQAGNVARSTELAEKLVAMESRDADYQYLLGQNLFQQGDRQGAIEHFKLAVEANPNHCDAILNLARLMVTSSPSQAEKYRQRFEDCRKSRRLSD
jgi:tetratricopeptide (TPR) repeat protein